MRLFQLCLWSMCATSFALHPPHSSQDDLFQQTVQAFLNNVSHQSGYSFSVGYVDGTTGTSFGWGAGPKTPPNFPTTGPTGTVSADDTMLLGSGTKPYTAAAIMRLVDAGKVALSDLASVHLDPVFHRMRPNTTFASLFGPPAEQVQVGHLIRMESGVGDFDIPGYDNQVLKSSGVVDVMATLDVVANFKAANGCTTFNCTW
jgi:CubicO group peptidase (beta-lactamase class C family)